jgi:NADH/NAD ratio-sensing transcriptional regulator Rex
MIMGEDEHGDMHLVGTNDQARAIAHYMRMTETMKHVQGNPAFMGMADPINGKAN